jgi:iron transport multicopper oxidase
MVLLFPRTALLGTVLALSTWQCAAKTVTYDFNVTWVTANPDGMTDRKVVGVNGEWPLPIIEVDKGDQLVVNMHNGLGDKSATIHFHGMYQNGTNEMDGPSMVTQCPIPPGADFTYNFTVNQNGTYWYHCHTDFCYPDGYRQALIVHDNEAYFYDQYDEEFVVTVSDWYHELVEGIAPDFLSVYNPTGAEPVPDAFLFNDTLNSNLPVKPNTTYLIRLINIGAFVAQYFYIDGHNFTIVEIDGVYTEPTEADILYIGIAQRYSILVTTKNSTDQNYAIVTVADSVLLDTIPSTLQLNNTNWLEYSASAPHDQANITVDQASDLDPFDDFTLVPYDHEPLLPDPDYEITVAVNMEVMGNGFGYALLDNISYTAPKVPTLYSVLSSGNLSTNSEIYGEFTHSWVLEHNDVVQIVLNNNDGGSHPFHLHGHNFQLIQREPPYGPNFYDYLDGDPIPYDPTNHTAFPATPARRDTFVLPPQGYFVIRFVADNPGVWFFHCHIDWHLSQGLGMLLIEAPEQMQERMSIPQQHYDVCQAANVPFIGNAAGNSENFLDLAGENKQQSFLPNGFTARGIVALLFSCICAIAGVIFIVVYGMSDLKFDNKEAAAVTIAIDNIPKEAAQTDVATDYRD